MWDGEEPASREKRARIRRRRSRSLEPWYHIAKAVALPPVKLWFNWRFEGQELVSAEGPVLVAGNHVSYLDPFAHAYFVARCGRRPRFLGKQELFDHPFLRIVLKGAGQIPVARGTGDRTPLEEALRALRGGEVVVIYPEGTVTRNADFSPMRGKTGVVRLALAANLPVLPIAVWGGQHVWQKSGKGSLKFGRPIWLKAGPPLDLSGHLEGANDPVMLRRLTGQVTDELTRLVNDLRSRYPKRWA